MAHNKVIRALHDLVATANDAAEGYGKAAKATRNTELSDWLATVSGDRQQFGQELSGAIRRMGETAGQDLHEGGILHRGWVDLEQSLRPKDEHEILRECLNGDAGTLKHYDHALTLDAPADLRELLIEQRTAVQDQISALEQKEATYKSRQGQGRATSATS